MSEGKKSEQKGLVFSSVDGLMHCPYCNKPAIPVAREEIGEASINMWYRCTCEEWIRAYGTPDTQGRE